MILPKEVFDIMGFAGFAPEINDACNLVWFDGDMTYFDIKAFKGGDYKYYIKQEKGKTIYCRTDEELITQVKKLIGPLPEIPVGYNLE